MEEPCGVEPMETNTKVLFKNTCCAPCKETEYGVESGKEKITPQLDWGNCVCTENKRLFVGEQLNERVVSVV